MRCSRCQRDTESASRFCDFCGFPLPRSSESTPPAPTPAPLGVAASLGIALGFLGLLAVVVVLLVTLRSPWQAAAEPEPSPTPPSPAVEPEPSASPDAPDPEADLAEYYRLLSADRFPEAFLLRSRRARAQTPLGEFERAWRNNRSVRVERFSVAALKPGRLQAEIRLVADDMDVAKGRAAVTSYLGKVNLALEDGRWRYDGGDFQAIPATGPP